MLNSAFSFVVKRPLRSRRFLALFLARFLSLSLSRSQCISRKPNVAGMARRRRRKSHRTRATSTHRANIMYRGCCTYKMLASSQIPVFSIYLHRACTGMHRSLGVYWRYLDRFKAINCSKSAENAHHLVRAYVGNFTTLSFSYSCFASGRRRRHERQLCLFLTHFFFEY